MSSRFFKIIIVFIAVLLLILNIKKYRELNDVVIPVWSSYDQEYYNHEDVSLIDKIKRNLSFERFIYSVTRVRLRAPITYLKSEIPLLGYYTPEELKTQTETIYKPNTGGNNVIRLKFSLTENTRKQLDEKEDSEGRVLKIPGNRVIPEEEERPVIAIYHTHTSETYMDDPRKQDSNGHVLPGNIGNVGKVGMELARVLSERYGFRVIHTTKVHDESYNRSYYNSRNTVKDLLRENQEIDLILDIHRDGIKAELTKDQITTVFNNERVANIMIVVANGKYTYGEIQETAYDWRENLALARSLSDWMDRLYPGLLRRIEERDTTTNRYNQDLSPVSLLVEIGDYRNTTQEAINAAHYLADAIAAMYGMR